MLYTINAAKKSVMNKWDWENPVNNTPVFLWGPIGIGKTELVQDLVAQRMISDLQELLNTNLTTAEKAKAETELKRLQSYDRPKEVEDILDRHLLTLRLAERPIEQLQGVPAPDFANKRTVFLMPENVQRFQAVKWCVVFVDELDKADEAKMTAATHLIESKRIGDFVFQKDTMIIAAANRVQDSFISKPIVPELRNRACHLELSVDIPSWIDYATKKNLSLEIVRFHTYKHKIGENWLAVYDEDSAVDTSTAFATPRTWHMAATHKARLLKNNPNISQKEWMAELEQFVGSKAASEYETYFALYSTIDIMDMLEGKVSLPTYDEANESSENTFNDILSKQYIYMYAICDQLKLEHFNNALYVENIIKFCFDIDNDLRNIFFLSLKKELIEKLMCLKELKGIFEEYIKSIMESCSIN